MNEKYLHFLWKNKRLTTINLRTTAGENLMIRNFGQYNTESGPDFFNGAIKLNDTVLHGNIELHVKSSDWIKHKHQFDDAYNNVILHVVFENDQDIYIDKRKVPTLELKSMIDFRHFQQFNQHINFNTSIPCEKFISEVPLHVVEAQLAICLNSRLHRKAMEIEEISCGNSNDLLQILFKILMRAFGGNVNGMSFTQLSHQVPVIPFLRASILSKESILYGISSSFIAENNDEYHLSLVREWNFQAHKMEIQSVAFSGLKFKGTRPPLYPTLRLAQFAAFAQKMDWSDPFWLKTASEIYIIFMHSLRAEISEYWKSHYHFGRLKKQPNSGELSVECANVIIINSIVPFLFWLGKHQRNVILQHKAIELLALIPAEKNRIVEQWNGRINKALNARSTQSLLELDKVWCAKKQCLNCSVGQKVLT